ncbi:MAG: hypothetical protein V7L29_04370, partial [Nostoc sp.]|uniref:hypothetical protein n=1 Tax=Nostoc sp. TaxID=1180 RepID=UPI002FF7240D
LVLLLPSWEKGLGDEGKTSSQSRFFLKLTPMHICVPLQNACITTEQNCNNRNRVIYKSFPTAPH